MCTHYCFFLHESAQEKTRVIGGKWRTCRILLYSISCSISCMHLLNTHSHVFSVNHASHHNQRAAVLGCNRRNTWVHCRYSCGESTLLFTQPCHDFGYCAFLDDPWWWIMGLIWYKPMLMHITIFKKRAALILCGLMALEMCHTCSPSQSILWSTLK